MGLSHLAVILLASCNVAYALQPISRAPQQPTGGGKRLLTYDLTTPSPALSPVSVSFNWVDLGPNSDGYHITTSSNGSLIIEHVFSRSKKIILPPSQEPGRGAVALNADQTKALLARNTTKQYRYSSFSNYFVQSVPYGATSPLDPDQKVDIQYAVWSPKDPNILAFVRKNNLFIWNNGTIIPITSDGGPDTFNGVPDWVYEEEIIENRHTTWFSPDGEYIAFLSFDETGVPTYTVPYYMDNQKFPPRYPRELKIRYPKVGSTNPKVKARVVKVNNPKEVVEVDLSSTFPPEDLIIGEVAWLTDAHERFVVRCFNRIQNRDKHLLYDVGTKTAKVVRERDGTDSWIDNSKSIKFVGAVAGAMNSSTNTTYYIDLSDQNGWTHLYMFPTTGGSPKQLTSGQWEIRSILSVDKARGRVYYASTERHPTESHMYSIDLRTGTKTALTNPLEPGYWTASFSARAKYFVLSYQGPNVPYQELHAFNSTQTPLRVISDNSRLTSRLQEYVLPQIQYFDLPHPSGHNLSAMLRLPANFSPEKKYPLLLTPYGGPGSQEVHKRFSSPGWAAYIGSDPELEYITYTVDNRGTGFRGRKFRAYLHKAMGTVDAEDQIWAASELIKNNSWVDGKKVGIWGWSNGGYLSAKVVEHNSGVITLGLVTAPTSDMRLYDSMFTERFMGVGPSSEAAYDQAAIRNSTGFKNIAGGVLIQHGTGDDNVHFQHTASLVDFLMGEGVPPGKLQAQFFPDSDHSIYHNNQQDFLYKMLTKRIWEEKQRDPSKPDNHQWAKANAPKAKSAKGKGGKSRWVTDGQVGQMIEIDEVDGLPEPVFDVFQEPTYGSKQRSFAASDEWAY